jgi:O-antigen/teichoic acid export membrane protein
MNKQKILIKNTLILAFGKVASQLIAFLLLPLYTFFLSPAEYGAVDLVITYVALLVPTITIQLEMAAFRFLVDARGNEAAKKLTISNILQIVSVVLATCLVIFGVVEFFIDIPYAPLVLLNIVVAIFSNLFLQIARGLGDNKKFAVASIITGVMTLIGAVLFVVVMQMGASGLLLSMALANLSCAIYLFVRLKIYKYTSFKNRDAVMQKSLLAYSFPLVPNGVSWWVINVSDRTVISIMLGVAANGIYAIANKFSLIFMSVFSIFQMSWTESASVHINDKDRDKFFSDTMNASLRLFGTLALALIAVIPLVFNWIVDTQYSEAYLYIPILIVAALFNAIVSLYGAIYIAKKLTKQVASTSIVSAVINIALTVVFIGHIGLFAAALATVVAYLAMAVYRHHDAKKYVTIRYNVRMIVMLIGMFAVVIALYYLNSIVGNVASVLLAIGFGYWANKSIVTMLWNKVMAVTGRNKNLTSEQEAYEDVI